MAHTLSCTVCNANVIVSDRVPKDPNWVCSFCINKTPPYFKGDTNASDDRPGDPEHKPTSGNT
jgi:hypothetical protein